MPTKTLPENPSLENLKKQAKELKQAVQTGETVSIASIRKFHPRGEAARNGFQLADAQLVIAREYGFPSWAKLKEYVELVKRFEWSPPNEVADSPEERLIRLSCLAYDAKWRRTDAEKARELLRVHPEITNRSIWAASAVGDLESVRRFLAGDNSLVNRKGGPFRWEPLLYACYSRVQVPGYSTLEVARTLLAAGANPNAGFLWQGLIPPFTALTGAFGNGEAGEHEPAHEQWRELARTLLEAGADPNDEQALYNRHFQPDDEHFRILFEFGLGRETNGPWFRRLGERLKSPARMLSEELWSAARKNYFERVKLLVEHGVDVNTPGVRDGRTSYEAAMRAGNSEIAQFLAKHGARTTKLSEEEEFAAACISGDHDKAKGIIARSPGIIERIGLHRRIEMLHRAVEGRRLEGVRLMAELGFEVSGQTKHDNVGMFLETTPLHNAAWMGDLEMVKLLIELGADTTIRDRNYNATPLGWAEYNNKQNVVEYLKSVGTRTNE